MSKLLRRFPHFGKKTTKSRTVSVQRKVPEGGSREPNKGRAYLPSRKSLIFLFMAYSLLLYLLLSKQKMVIVRLR